MSACFRIGVLLQPYRNRSAINQPDVRTPNSIQPTYLISLSSSRIRGHILLYFQVVQHIKISVQFVILIERL